MKGDVKQAMEVKTVKISELKPHPRNPRGHPDSAIARLAKSIKEFGWTNPILVSKDGYILAGHARLKAAEQAGLKKVPVIYLPLSGAKADAYMVADNRLRDLTDWNLPKLKNILEELDTGEFDLNITGFDDKEREELLATTYEPHDIESLLEAIDLSNAIDKPIWVVARTTPDKRGLLESTLALLEREGIKVERSYEV